MNNKCRVLIMIGLIVLLAVSAPAQNGFTFSPAIRAGNPAPVPRQLGSILEFSINPQGQIAVIGDGGLFIKSGFNTTVVTAPSEPAPGGGVFLSVDSPIINSQGQVAFRGNVTFPGTSGMFLFAGGHLTLAIADGTIASDGQPVMPSPIAMNSSGDLVVSSNNSLYLFSHGSLTLLVANGQTAPGGGTFSFFVGASLNQSDQLAFQAFLSTGGSGIFLLSGGTISKIIEQGDVFPDGAVFAFPDLPSINDAGQIAFPGVSSSAADGGVFLFTGGQLTVVVPRATPIGGGLFFDSAFSVSLNNAGQIAFTGFITSLEGNGVFLFSKGQLTVLMFPGQTAPDGGTFSNSVEVGAEIDSSGQVIFLGNESLRGNALYSFSQGQISRVIGQGDGIPFQPRFAFPVAREIGQNDTLLIADSTFPGGSGFYTSAPVRNASLVTHIGQSVGVDGVVDFLFGAAMNRQLQVAVGASPSTSFNSLFLVSGGQTAILGDASSSVVPQGSPAINNLGQVAFLGFAPATGQDGLFLNAAGQISLLVDTATPLPTGGTLNSIENVSLNNQGQVAFLSEFSFPSPNAIYLSTAGQVTPLARDGDPAPGGGNFSIPFGNLRFGPVINDSGEVAFATSLTGTSGGFFGSGGVFLLSQGNLTRIVGPGDPSPDGGVFLFADSPSINASGQVAFFAETSAFGFGVFTYSQGNIVKVAIAGDFAGQEELGFADVPKINDNGHVGFTANLLDGSNATFVAAPNTQAPAISPAASAAAPLSMQQMQQLRNRNSLLIAQPQRKQNTSRQNPLGLISVAR